MSLEAGTTNVASGNLWHLFAIKDNWCQSLVYYFQQRLSNGMQYKWAT
jgi:hypothetical protein